MVHLVCKLTWQDGAEVVAEMRAASPHEDFPVSYRGATERLPERLEVSDAPLLQVVFKTIAREMGIRYETQVTGNYDRWIE